MSVFGFIALSGPLATLRVMPFPQPDAMEPQGIIHDLGQPGLLPAVVIVAIADEFLI